MNRILFNIGCSVPDPDLSLVEPSPLLLVRIRNTDIRVYYIFVQLLVEKKADLLTEYYDPSSLLCSDEVSNYRYGIFGIVVAPNSLFQVNLDPYTDPGF